MALIAIVHIPDHTADRESIADITNYLVDPERYRLVGLYEFPNRSELKCSGYCVIKNSGRWHRDRMGFMKCRVCGFRNKTLRRSFVSALFDWFGANLVNHSAPVLFKSPEGYGPRDH